MDSAAARWNKFVLVDCALAAQHAGEYRAVGWACAHGIQDVAPAGAEQP